MNSYDYTTFSLLVEVVTYLTMNYPSIDEISNSLRINHHQVLLIGEPSNKF